MLAVSLPKTSGRRIIPVKLFYRVFLSRADASRYHLSTAFMQADFFNARVRARKVLARPHDYHVRTLAPPQATQARETLISFFENMVENGRSDDPFCQTFGLRYV